MSIVGSLNSGLLGDHTMLFAKSLLDGVSSVVFSVSFGIGVPLSAIAVFVYEALITLAASVLAPLLSDAVIAEMTCVGSLMIIGLALNMLGLTKIKVTNFIPPFFFRSCFAGLCDGRSCVKFEPSPLVRRDFSYTQDHRHSRWLAQALYGHVTGRTLRCIEVLPFARNAPLLLK